MLPGHGITHNSTLRLKNPPVYFECFRILRPSGMSRAACPNPTGARAARPRVQQHISTTRDHTFREQCKKLGKRTRRLPAIASVTRDGQMVLPLLGERAGERASVHSNISLQSWNVGTD